MNICIQPFLVGIEFRFFSFYCNTDGGIKAPLGARVSNIVDG